MKKLTLVIVILGLLVAVAGCAAAPAPTTPRNAASVAPAPQRPAAAADSKAVTSAEYAANTPAGDAERMIIRTADLSIVVTDAAQAQQSLADTVKALGGYIANANTWREGEQLRARMTVRVPADKLDALLAAVKASAVRVQSESIKGQDVTEEFSDLKAQLTNLEATEVELRELLSEVRQRTQKAEDVLAVYRELTTIRGEIERVKGRMQFLSTMTDMATANVDLIPDVLAKPVVEPGWRPLETLKGAGRSLVNAFKGLVDILIYLVVLVLPVLLVLGGGIFVVIKVLRRLFGKRKPRVDGPKA